MGRPGTGRRGAAPALALLGTLALALLAFVLTASLPAAATGGPAVLSRPTIVVTAATPSDRPCRKAERTGQPNACPSSGISVALAADRDGTALPSHVLSRLSPPRGTDRVAQTCATPPDRPPRFAA